MAPRDVWLDAGNLIDTVSGLALLALGLLIWWRSRRTPQMVRFVLFACLFGIERIVGNLLQFRGPPDAGADTVNTMLSLATGVALIYAMTAAPGRGGWVWLAAFIAIAVTPLALFTFTEWDTFAARSFEQGRHPWPGAAFGLAQMFKVGTMAGGAAMLGYRWPRIPEVHRQSTALTSAGLSVVVGTYGGWQLVGVASRPGITQADNAVYVAMAGGLAAIWLWRMLNDPAARPVALTVLGCMAAQAMFTSLVPFGFHDSSDLGTFGLARVAAALLFGYGALRESALGLDARVRDALATAVVVTSFVLVFVAANATRIWIADPFATALGATAIGWMALRVRDLRSIGMRLAARAMPEARPPSEYPRDERMGMYERLAKACWADGRLSRAEGRLLDDARSQLGLSLEEASSVERAARA